MNDNDICDNCGRNLEDDEWRSLLSEDEVDASESWYDGHIMIKMMAYIIVY